MHVKTRLASDWLLKMRPVTFQCSTLSHFFFITCWNILLHDQVSLALSFHSSLGVISHHDLLNKQHTQCFAIFTTLRQGVHGSIGAKTTGQNTTVITFIYLNDAAPAWCCFHRLQEDCVGVLAAAATGEDDTTPPATGHSRRHAVRRSVAAQPVSKSIALRHVDEKGDDKGSI